MEGVFIFVSTPNVEKHINYFLEWCTYSGTYKTTILCAGVVKSLARNIGRPYPGLEFKNLHGCMHHKWLMESIQRMLAQLK
jgi:hypothetical protein